ncbi:MAG: TldD/PmbA family protein [Nitrospirae bacterium]|nr:TldD/PmbA family protein [Nitrospirota bacterium]
MNREFAARLMDIAMSRGVDEAEVYVKTSKSLGIEVKGQKIETIESSKTLGYCIRVIKDKRLGFSYSTDPAEINSAAEKAIEASKYSEPDDYAGLPSNLEPSHVNIFDNEIVLLREEDAIDRVMRLESSALNENSRIRKIRKASGSFVTSDTYILNSNGINVHYPSTGCSAQIMAIAENDNESQMGWDYEGSRFLKDVSFEQVGRNAAKNALRLLGAEKISPLKGFILLDSSIASDFLGVLSSALSSESVQKGKSMLAGKKGEPVASPGLNILDNGLLDGRLGSKPVDDEGVPTSNKTLIEKGILKGFLYNTYTARKDSVTSTGNAVRGGASGLPTVGPSNLYMEPASSEYSAGFEGLLKNVDKGMYVIETMGMHTAFYGHIGALSLLIEGIDISG